MGLIGEGRKYQVTPMIMRILAVLPIALGLSVPPVPVSAQAMTVSQLQIALAGVGHDPGPADGVYDAETIRALAAFAVAHKQAFNGTPSPRLLQVLEWAYIMSQSEEGCEDC